MHTNAFSGGKIQATYDGTDTTFYLGDWLGTKRVEVGASGCATGYTSLAYGDGLTTVALPGFTACASDATEHHYTGKERDNESGNDYFGARYYASSMGRFMSPDWSAKEEPVPYARLDNPQTLNLYAYLMNNPLAGVDADGHCAGGGWCELGGQSDIAARWAAQQAANITKLFVKPPPPPTPAAPKAPPILMVNTSISGNTTSMTISTHDKTTTRTVESLTKATNDWLKDHPGADGPLVTTIRGILTDPGHIGHSYGPLGATMDTGDERRRLFHAGGGKDWEEPYQGLVPTHGCTRLHTQDAIELNRDITKFMDNHPESGHPFWVRE